MVNKEDKTPIAGNREAVSVTEKLTREQKRQRAAEIDEKLRGITDALHTSVARLSQLMGRDVPAELAKTDPQHRHNEPQKSDSWVNSTNPNQKTKRER